jgi:hypothetical protein
LIGATTLAACGSSNGAPAGGEDAGGSGDATSVPPDAGAPSSDDGASSGDGAVAHDASAADGSADDADGGPSYSSFQDPQNWAQSSVIGGITFSASVFDGRYAYFAGNESGGPPSVVRYDTRAPFDALTSWLGSPSFGSLDPVIDALSGIGGVAFDGRYVYFVTSVVVRYDTQADFSTPSSWATFDPSAGLGVGKTNLNAAFDGRFLYYEAVRGAGGPGGTPDGAPPAADAIVRYDTHASFAMASSWAAFDLAALGAGVGGFWGATFDGRYVYFDPFSNAVDDAGTELLDGRMPRFDTQAPFETASSWSIFDTTQLGQAVAGFDGSISDGRYVYFAPYGSTALRFDSHASFAATASWTTFDLSNVPGAMTDLGTPVFDGRFVYYTSLELVSGSSAHFLREDTHADFGSATSWEVFDTTTSFPQAGAYSGGLFDGHYVYFAPSGAGAFLRFATTK